MARDYVCLYHSYLDAIQALGDAERGRLLTAMLEYSLSGATGHLSGNERFIWPLVKAQIDRDAEKYDKKCQINAENGSKRTQANATERKRTLPNATETSQGKGKGEYKGKGKGKGKNEGEGKGENIGPAPARTAYGQYKWVKLTDDEYQRLLSDLGQVELDRCIAYVDESAQSTGNKNSWRDWNLVVRRCHRDKWGLNTKSPPKSMRPGTDTNPTPERIKANADWLDEFLAEQEAGGG